MRVRRNVRPRLRVATAFTSARENRSLMQHKGVVIDLLNEEIRDVGALDEPACPVARID